MTFREFMRLIFGGGRQKPTSAPIQTRSQTVAPVQTQAVAPVQPNPPPPVSFPKPTPTPTPKFVNIPKPTPAPIPTPKPTPKPTPTPPSSSAVKMHPKGSTYTAKEKSRIFGTPGTDKMAQKMVVIDTPFKLNLYGQGTHTSRMSCHPLVARNVQLVLEQVLRVYGITRIRALKLDHYHGSFSPRKIRGGNSWSSHAYGIAFDFYAADNGLHTKFKDSAFSRSEYAEYLRIWERHGFVNLGRLQGFERDAMHFEAGRLPGGTWE